MLFFSSVVAADYLLLEVPLTLDVHPYFLAYFLGTHPDNILNTLLLICYDKEFNTELVRFLLITRLDRKIY